MSETLINRWRVWLNLRRFLWGAFDLNSGSKQIQVTWRVLNILMWYFFINSFGFLRETSSFCEEKLTKMFHQIFYTQRADGGQKTGLCGDAFGGRSHSADVTRLLKNTLHVQLDLTYSLYLSLSFMFHCNLRHSIFQKFRSIFVFVDSTVAHVSFIVCTHFKFSANRFGVIKVLKSNHLSAIKLASKLKFMWI